ncbi:MAG: Na+/H+ antiporter subunit E [Rhodobacteraceae bacterium]|jgi:multicomponent K+:H+ antiporter subunit E|nr:Na+/H+ antiporter subunit E [Paracoccaceae bacterium]
MMRNLLPRPVMTIWLAIAWTMLNNSIAPGTWAMGLIIGMIVPFLTAPYAPDRPTMRVGWPLVEFLAVLIWDIILANITVAGQVLFMPNARMRPAWVVIPLDLTRPEAITALSATITMTPGTLTAEMSTDGRALLVHCLHAPNPDAVRDEIKSRYERRLKEIFE